MPFHTFDLPDSFGSFLSSSFPSFFKILFPLFIALCLFANQTLKLKAKCQRRYFSLRLIGYYILGKGQGLLFSSSLPVPYTSGLDFGNSPLHVPFIYLDSNQIAAPTAPG